MAPGLPQLRASLCEALGLLGINPGLVKWEGTQSVLWGEEVRERFDDPELNLARYIKDGTVTDQDNGE
ncbi:hypothetical protein [Streptomyces cellulosae]|uniref:Uncharacterized protein n=1 Tax=Streptomyces cellulosae TaxID=1968 RepID=A0ABW7YJZ8_STRCE